MSNFNGIQDISTVCTVLVNGFRCKKWTFKKSLKDARQVVKVVQKELYDPK